MEDSGSAAPDDAARARIDSLALELSDGARERFRAYQRELGAKEWAPLYVGEIQRFATCFSPMIDQLVLAHLECGWVPTRIPHAVMACIVSAVNTPTFDTSRGPDYPPIPRMPATYPWMVSTLFDNEQFRSALLGVITQSLAKATESQIRNGLETQSPHGKTNNIATLQRNDGLLKDSSESEDSATEALPTDQAIRPVRNDAKGAGQLAGDSAAAKKNKKKLLKVGKTRSLWLDGRRSQKQWSSDLDIASHGGPTYNTIQRYRSGKKSTHDPAVRLKFATAFDCELAEVPD